MCPNLTPPKLQSPWQQARYTKMEGGRWTLGIDLGNSMGVAIACDDTIVRSEQIDLSGKGGHPIDRFDYFDAYILRLLKSGIRAIYYEKVISHTAKNPKTGRVTFNVEAAHTYGYYEKTLQKLGRRFGVPVTPYHVGTLKMRYTGSGRAKKEDVCREAMKRGWGNGETFKSRNHDEADAVMALTIGLEDEGVKARFPGGELANRRKAYSNLSGRGLMLTPTTLAPIFPTG